MCYRRNVQMTLTWRLANMEVIWRLTEGHTNHQNQKIWILKAHNEKSKVWFVATHITRRDTNISIFSMFKEKPWKPNVGKGKSMLWFRALIEKFDCSSAEWSIVKKSAWPLWFFTFIEGGTLRKGNGKRRRKWSKFSKCNK